MADPFISAVSPTSGSSAGGTILTLTGTDLDALSQVYFGDTYEYESINPVNSTTATIVAPPHVGGDVLVASNGAHSADAEIAWPFSSATSLSVDITPNSDAAHPNAIEFGADYKFLGSPGWTPGTITLRFISTSDDTGTRGSSYRNKAVYLYASGPATTVRFFAGYGVFPNPFAPDGWSYYGTTLNPLGTAGGVGQPFDWEDGVTYRCVLTKSGTFTENGGGNWFRLSITNLSTSDTATDYLSLGIAAGQGDFSPLGSKMRVYSSRVGGSLSTASRLPAAASFTNLRADVSTAPSSITGAVVAPYASATNITDGVRLDAAINPGFPTFSYIDYSPAITDLSPSSGPTAGGDTVVITGTNFTDATAVSFGAAPAAAFTVDSSTQITATSPIGVAGIVDVTVVGPDGTSAASASSKFTFVPPGAPTVTGLTPTTGTTEGGTVVTITGTNLAETTSVKFGAINAASFSVLSDTSVSTVAPVGVDGIVDVTVVNPGGTSATGSASKFTYVEPPALPTVTSLLPKVGTTAGGTIVTITGTSLDEATAVSFGGTPAASFTIFSATTIFATTPPGVAGDVDVTATTPGGESETTTSTTYSYVTPTIPVVTGVSPAVGPSTGGSTVTIKGSGFGAVTAVEFDGVPATSFVLVDTRTVRAVAPAGSVGDVDVTVTTSSGTSATGAASTFSYVTPPSAPTVTSLSADSGSTLGGTTVTITGTGLSGATSVRFGTTPAGLVTLVSPTTITATAPVHAAGTVNVTVVTPGGTSGTGTATEFTYVSPDDPGGGLAPIVAPPPAPAKRDRDMRVLLYDDTMSNPPQVFTKGTSFKASDPANDIGTVSFTLPYGDATDAAQNVAGGKIVQVQVLNASNAYVDCYLGRIEAGNNKKISTTRGDRSRSFSCRGLASDFEKSKVYPHGGVNRIPWGDTRTFGWAAPELDTTSWPEANERSIQGDDDSRPPYGLAGFPYTWPNPLTFWLWGQPPVAGSHDPDGICYFQFRFSTSQELDVTFFVTADDLFVAALDGVPIVEFRESPSDAADKTYFRKLKIPAGNHCFAVKAENLPRPGIPDNTGIINVCATYDIAPGDPLFTGGYETRRYLFTSVGVNVNSPQLATELQPWKTLAYPAMPPGLTPGRILEILLAEAQARGELVGWSLGCNGTLDTNNAAWSAVPDFGMGVGQSFLEVLNKLVSDGWIDWAVDTSAMVLNVWNQGTRGSSVPDAVYAEGVNIEELEHDEKWGGYRGKLLIRWADGFTEVGAGQFGDFLSVSDAVDLTEAVRRGQINLNRLDDDSTGIVMQGRPLNDAQTPWIGFTIGSSITVPGPDDVPAEYIVTSIVASEMDEVGQITWDIQLVSRRRAAEDRLAKVAERALPGGLNGRTDSVVAATKSQPAGGALDMDELMYNLSGPAAQADVAAVAQGYTEARSGPARTTRRLKLQRATLEAAGGTTGSAIVDFYVAGHLAITMFLVGSMLYAADHFGSGSGNWFIEVDPGQTLSVRLRNNPGDQDGLVLRIFGSPLP